MSIIADLALVNVHCWVKDGFRLYILSYSFNPLSLDADLYLALLKMIKYTLKNIIDLSSVTLFRNASTVIINI